MKKVIKLQHKKHIYKLDYCAGCGGVIDGDYTELGLPTDKEVKHIALCGVCSGAAKKEGVI